MNASKPVISYIPAIDGLRAVAVTSVIIYHLSDSFLPGGYLGVDIFFVISGFVVTFSLMTGSFSSPFDLLSHFYARRLLRIMPALLVMLVLTGLATAMFVPSAWLSSQNEKVGKYAFVGLSNIQLAFTSDSYFSPRVSFNPFVHTWSLGVEEQFYFVFPFFFYLLYRQRKAGKSTAAIFNLLLGSIALSLALAAFLMVMGRQQVAFYLMPSRFWELGLGAALCIAWKDRFADFDRKTIAVISIAALLVVLISFCLPLSDYSPFPASIPAVLATAALIGIVSTRQDTLAASILSRPLPVLVGKASYSLYLWHWPVFVLFRWTVGLETVPTYVAALLIMTALSFLSYYVIEGNTRHIRVRSAMPRAAVISSGAVILAAGLAGYLWMMEHRSVFSQSVTARADLWYPEELTALDARNNLCKSLTIRRDAIAGGEITTFTPNDCAMARPTRRLFVVGDSHNLVYVPSYKQLAADTGIEVRSYYKGACPFIDLMVPMNTRGSCTEYFQATVDQLSAELTSDDVLFLPTLRMARIGDQWGAVKPISFAYEASLSEAKDVLARIIQKGTRIIFEAPTPVFPSPAFRCADWFNRMNPICGGGLSVRLDEINSRREKVMASMKALAAAWPAIEIWDPTPALCRNNECHAIAENGMPLFFDGDHLTAYANTVLYPSLRSRIRTQ